MTVACYKALKAKHHNAFSGVEKVLGAHSDTELKDTASKKMVGRTKGRIAT
jgi:hypothetical protein